MDTLAEIERAVQLSHSLASSGNAPDHALKEQVNQYLKDLERSPSGWKYGLELCTHTSDDYTRFYALGLVQGTLERESLYSLLSQEDRGLLRSTFLQYVSQKVPTLANEPPFLRNKLGVLLSLLVKREYPHAWPDAFQTLLQIAQSNRAGASLLLKVLQYITEEVVSLPSQRDNRERTQNTAVKDAMRVNALPDIIQFWHQVVSIQASSESDVKLVQECLIVMHEYIGWIDINLIVNDQFIPRLFDFLQNSKEFRVHTLKCFREIVKKGMNFESKVTLLNNLDLLTVLHRECVKEDEERMKKKRTGTGNGSGENPFGIVTADGEEDEDEDDEEEGWGFRENISCLVTDIGLQLMDARLGLPKDHPLQSYILGQLSSRVLPMALFQCLGSTDQDAQEMIIPLISKMLSILREQTENEMGQKGSSVALREIQRRNTRQRTPPKTQMPPDPELEQVFRNTLPQLLPIIVRQMCYPSNFTFDPRDDDELEFDAHRLELKTLFVNVVKVAAIDAVLPFLQEATRYILDPSQVHSRPPYQVEVTLTLLHSFAEGSPSGIVAPSAHSILEMAQLGNMLVKKKTQDAAQSENVVPNEPNDLAKAAAEDERRRQARQVFIELVSAAYHCPLFNHSNPRVVLAYNTLVARYAGILQSHCSDMIVPVLEGLLGTGGIQHPDNTVRSMSCSLLYKVVQGLSTALTPFAGDMLNLLKGFLVVSHDAVLADMIAEEEQQYTVEAPPVPSLYSTGQDPSFRPQYSIENTMYLFETASILIGLDKDSGDTNVIKERLEVIVQPVHAKLDEIIRNVPTTPVTQLNDEQLRQRKLLGNWAGECIHALSELTKGLKGSQRVAPAVADIFKSCLETALRALNAMPDHMLLGSRFVTMLHSLVSVLGDSVIDFGPAIGVRLLEQRDDLDKVLEAMQFINQLVSSFKGKMYQVLDQLFLRIISRVVKVLASVPDPFSPSASPVSTPATSSQPISNSSNGGAVVASGANTQAQQEFRSVKRILMLFLLNVVENDLDPVLYSPTNSPHLEQVIQLVMDTMSNFPDPSAKQTAVKVLNCLSSRWLVQEKSAGLDPNLRNAFVRLLLEKISVATFQLTGSLNFVDDELECVRLLEKICALHKTLAKNLGQQWLQYLVETTLPSISCPPQLALEYTNKVADTSLKSKVLAQEFRRLFLSK